MRDDVKRCVDMRVNYFADYFTIPQELQGEMDAFISELELLGEQCKDATEFEAKFVELGLSDQFNGIIPRCTPKPVKITKEDRRNMWKKTKEMVRENKKELIQSEAETVGKHILSEVSLDLYEKKCDEMEEKGTYDDHKKSLDKVRTVEHIADLFNFFGRKKK